VPCELREHCLRDEVVVPTSLTIHIVLRRDLVCLMHALAALQTACCNFSVTVAHGFIVGGHDCRLWSARPPAASEVDTGEPSRICGVDPNTLAGVILVADVWREDLDGVVDTGYGQGGLIWVSCDGQYTRVIRTLSCNVPWTTFTTSPSPSRMLTSCAVLRSHMKTCPESLPLTTYSSWSPK
jgi:hypothetical protein